MQIVQCTRANEPWGGAMVFPKVVTFTGVECAVKFKVELKQTRSYRTFIARANHLLIYR